MSGRNPVHRRQRSALRVADRDQRRISKSFVHRMKIGDVEASVHRRNGWHFRQAREWERPIVYVGVHDVEIVAGALENLRQHRQLQRCAEFRLALQPQRLPASRHEVRPRNRIPGREQRHLMPASHKFLGDVRHHALGATVEPGRHTFIQRRDLRDTQTRTAQNSEISVGVQLSYLPTVRPARWRL